MHAGQGQEWLLIPAQYATNDGLSTTFKKFSGEIMLMMGLYSLTTTEIFFINQNIKYVTTDN